MSEVEQQVRDAAVKPEEVTFILQALGEVDRTWDGVERRNVCSDEARTAQKQRYEEA